MKSIYFHEDDYCQIEILPAENLGFCLEQAGLIDDFAENHRDGMGYTDVFVRNENPVSILDKKITKAVFEEVFESVFPRCDVIYTGYGSYREKCKFTSAFGHDENVVIFYEWKDGFINNIWLTLDIRKEVDVEAANKLFTALSKLGDFIVADWGWGFIEKISSEKTLQYIQSRLATFSPK